MESEYQRCPPGAAARSLLLDPDVATATTPNPAAASGAVRGESLARQTNGPDYRK